MALLPLFALVLPDDGRAILSGMLLSERPNLIRELSDAGWQVEAEELEGDWWSATIARR
jgi:ribosomal protein L11 methylase PrmA